MGKEEKAAAQGLYSMGRFLRRTMPSPCSPSLPRRRQTDLEPLAAELLGGSIGGVGPFKGHTVVVPPNRNAQQEMAIRTASLGSITPSNGAIPMRLLLLTMRKATRLDESFLI